MAVALYPAHELAIGAVEERIGPEMHDGRGQAACDPPGADAALRRNGHGWRRHKDRHVDGIVVVSGIGEDGADRGSPDLMSAQIRLEFRGERPPSSRDFLLRDTGMEAEDILRVQVQGAHW